MEIRVQRYRFTDEATLSRVTIDGERWGYMVEDQDRGLSRDMPNLAVLAEKVPAETAIPIGTYLVKFTYSPKYADTMRHRYGRPDGFMPEVLDVPGFRGVRVHSGNSEGDTAGCLLPGFGVDEAGMRVLRSRDACKDIYQRIEAAEAQGESVVVIIYREPEAWAAFSEGQA